MGRRSTHSLVDLLGNNRQADSFMRAYVRPPLLSLSGPLVDFSLFDGLVRWVVVGLLLRYVTE